MIKAHELTPPTPALWGTPLSLSHHCNSGDQHVNLSLRRHIRRQSKLRPLHHGVLVQDGKIPGHTKLRMGHHTMKPLLCQWVGEWMDLPDLHAWVRSSSQIVTRRAPLTDNVDGNPGLPAVLCLPPPMIPAEIDLAMEVPDPGEDVVSDSEEEPEDDNPIPLNEAQRRLQEEADAILAQALANGRRLQPDRPAKHRRL